MVGPMPRLGVARFGSAVVVNPGSLRYTRTYASVTLEERRIEGRTEWRVTRAAVADISDSSNDAEEPPYVTSPHLAALALSMIVFLLVALAASCARPSRRVPAPPVAFSKTPKSPQISRPRVRSVSCEGSLHIFFFGEGMTFTRGEGSDGGPGERGERGRDLGDMPLTQQSRQSGSRVASGGLAACRSSAGAGAT